MSTRCRRCGRSRRLALGSTRALAHLCILLFAASTAFPVTAGILDTDTPSRLLGISDVVVGVLLFVASATIASRRRGKVTSHDQIRAFGVSQIVFAAIPALLIVFFVVGDRIDWRFGCDSPRQLQVAATVSRRSR